MKTPIHRYTSGQPYCRAIGRNRPDDGIHDRLVKALAVIDLDEEQPSVTEFFSRVRRELKIRHYAHNTIKSYLQVVKSVIRWLGRQPHHLSRQHVRCYLEYLYDAGHGASEMGVHLSAIRTIWDKFCYRDVTLGLETPRKKRTRPVVPSREEITRLLEACPSIRDTLLVGLMYGTGMRVSEVCRVRWQDIDIDRSQIFIHQGKGNADRHVQLPKQYQALFQRLKSQPQQNDFVFPAESLLDRRRNRHLNPRTVQRLVKSACAIAGIEKRITPHSLRHGFATHSFEDGCDIRRIQKVLGHRNLETTTIYVTVAKQQTSFASPLDRLDAGNPNSPTPPNAGNPPADPPPANPVGKFQIHHRTHPQDESLPDATKRRQQITIEISGQGFREFLVGTVAQVQRPGYVKIDFPPGEQWKLILDRLPMHVSARIETPEFYQAIQQRITQRVCQRTGAAPILANSS